MVKNNNYMRTFIYVYLFMMVYTPNVGLIFGNSTNIIIVNILTFTTIVLVGIFKYKIYKYDKLIKIINKKSVIFVSTLSIAYLYGSLIAIANGFFPRIIQDFSLIIQFVQILILMYIFEKEKYSKLDIFDILLNIALIQSIICILMIFIPSFKEFANQCYYASGAIPNEFITSKRIFGFFGEYTFATPIYHGILFALSLALSAKSKKYYIYIPFLLLLILLNGRTGMIPCFIGITVILSLTLLKDFNIKKIFKLLTIFSLIMLIGILLIKFISPMTYSWIMSFFDDIINLFNGELTGNFSILFGKMLYFPTGLNFIFGEGHIVYGIPNFVHSDIGYVNNIFYGGIIYSLIIYSAVFIYLKPKRKMIINDTNSIINYQLFYTFVIVLFICNIKGEVFRSGILLLGILFISTVLNSDKIRW